MRRFFLILLAFAVPLLTAAASAESPAPVVVRYAQRFTVQAHGDCRLVTVIDPWREAATRFRYALVPRGREVPEACRDAQVFRTPVASVVALSTTYLAYLDQLGVADRVVGVADAGRVNTPSVRERIRAGKVRQIGTSPRIDMEVLLELAPELVLTYGIGEPEDDTHPAMIRAGLPVALTAEYLETTPLGRTEWIKFIALFFGKEAQAERIFAEVARRYEDLRALAARAQDRPTVFLNADFQGTWYVPGGKGYMARFLADAGAAYLFADDPGTATRPVDPEVIFERAAGARFWLHPGSCRTMRELLALDPRYRAFAAARACAVYNNNARGAEGGGTDFWETGTANPHVVLADLVRIFHPELLPDHQLVYYRRLDCEAAR